MWLLQAASYSSARKKYVDTGVIPQDVFEKLSDLDGSQNKKYLEFICYLYANKDVVDKVIKKWEFHFEYGTSFESQYHKVSFLFSDVLYLLERGGLKFNLDSLKSPESVLNFFEDCFRLIYRLAFKSLGLGRLKEGEDYKIVASGGVQSNSTNPNRSRYWFIVRVHNQPAANVIGSGTPWCVVPKGNNHWEGDYFLDTFNTFYVIYIFDHFILKGIPHEVTNKYGVVWGNNSLNNPIDFVDSNNKKLNIYRASKEIGLLSGFIKDTFDKNRIKRGKDFPKEVLDFIFFMKEYWKINSDLVDDVIWDKNSRTLKFPNETKLHIDLGFLKQFDGFLFPDRMDFYLDGVTLFELKGSGGTLESLEGFRCFGSGSPKRLIVDGPIKIKSTLGVEYFKVVEFSNCEIEVFSDLGCGFFIRNCKISKLGPSKQGEFDPMYQDIVVENSDFPWGEFGSISFNGGRDFKPAKIIYIIIGPGVKTSLRGLRGDSKSVFQIRTNGEVDLGGAEFKNDLFISYDPYKPVEGIVFKGELGPIGGDLVVNLSPSANESKHRDLTSWIPSYVGGNLRMAGFSTKDFKFLSNCRVGGEVHLSSINFMGGIFNFMGLETLITQKITIELYNKIKGIDFDHFPYQIPYIYIKEKRRHEVHKRFVEDFINSGVKKKYKGIFKLNGIEV